MPWLILFLLLAVPATEIALFIQVSHWLGFLGAVGLAILAGMVGMALLRRQGLSVLMRARQRLEMGDTPVAETLDGLILTVAGIFLVLPGFASDILAVPLLIPPLRAKLATALAARLVVRPSGPATIDGEYQVIDPDPPHLPR